MVTGLVVAKKVTLFAAPIIASCIWNNTDINEQPSNYNQPQAIIQQVKVAGRDYACPAFIDDPILNHNDLICNNVFGTQSFE